MSSFPPPVYAHGHSTATVAAHAARTAEFSAAHLLPHLSPGTSVLDVGCGPGSITVGFVRYVSPGGRVVGIDSSAAVIATAKQQQQAQSPGNAPGNGSNNDAAALEFEVGNLFQLPFEDGSFDVVHAHQVFVHLPLDKIGTALRELKRVCKAGGLVALRDGYVGHNGLQAWPYNPLLMRTMELLIKRAHVNGGTTPDAQGLWVKIAREDIGFAKVERRLTLDVLDTPELKETRGGQWVTRTEEDGFRTFVKENGLMTEEELEDIPQEWRRWRDTEDGWSTLLQVEHALWK